MKSSGGKKNNTVKHSSDVKNELINALKKT
jgi:hypothetical protein